MTYVLEIIQHVIVTILIGYLALTNSLASYIESLIYNETENTEIILDESAHDTTFDKVVAVAEKYTGTIPRVLLENSEFQRAATLASKRDENNFEIPSEIDTEKVIEEALVNIYCQYKTDTHIRTTTGTGYFINTKGVILTNAHVAQFLLLEDTEDIVRDVECVIRQGNPAKPTYKAELLYISPTWIFENATLIDDEAPRGTGERDYALLYVSESIVKSPLPTQFPIIPVDTNLLSHGLVGTNVLSAGYPAAKLIKNGPDAKLEPVVAESAVNTLYTFGSNYADIFSISDSPVGEQGASGGPVVHPDRYAIGLIVTKGDEILEGTHSLRALSLSYIDRTMIEETGFSLPQNMLGDVALRGSIFKEAIAPFLTQLLTDELRN